MGSPSTLVSAFLTSARNVVRLFRIPKRAGRSYTSGAYSVRRCAGIPRLLDIDRVKTVMHRRAALSFVADRPNIQKPFREDQLRKSRIAHP